ncbi:MAG: lipopolysaccharide transport system permease protein [Planctomycetota bacterium]|jgi:lipopolysaccharide transport system permease protein
MSRLKEIYRSRELLYFLTWRDVKIRYKQTLLGAAWAVLQPLITMVVFTIFFGRLAGISTGDMPGPIFYYLALLPWTFFAAGITNAGNSLITNTDLLTKVYFPRAILPASTILAGLVDLAIASMLLGFLLPYYGVALDMEAFVWPLAILVLVVLTLGAGMLIAAINVLYRDVKYALPFVVQLMLFVSPVIYDTDKIPEEYRWLMLLNPLSGIIETSRAAIVPGQSIDWAHFGISAGIAGLIFLVGSFYFYRVQRRFADLV